MKIKSKLVSMSVTILLTVTFALQSFAAIAPFTDLTNVVAKDKILSLQERGYLTGIGDCLFAPDSSVTAAQGIQFIVSSLELNLDLVRFIKEPKATDYFPKADNTAWYANTLIIATINGIELPKDLDPNKEWTREEFTYHLIYAIEKKGHLPSINIISVKVADQDKLTSSYDGAIQRALVYGVAKLDADSKFNPKAGISRAAAAEQIYNALEYLNSHPAPQIKETPNEELK